MDLPRNPKCPECGNEEGLYMRVDVRWQTVTESWEIVDDIGEEGTIDCTECDHQWKITDAS